MRCATLVFFIVFSTFMIHIAQAHVCNDVTPGGAQYNAGCRDPFALGTTNPTINGNTISFGIVVDNINTIDDCYNIGCPPCNAGAVDLSGVRVSDWSVSAYSSDFSYTASPSSFSLSSGGEKTFSVTVTVSGNPPTDTYYLTFYLISNEMNNARQVELSIDWTQESSSCSGTDTNCGAYPNCANCNSQDGWYCNSGSVKIYRNYYCSGTSCSHTDSQSTDCTTQNGCSGGLSKTYGCSSGSCVQTASSCTEACCDAYYSNSNAFCSGSTCNPPPSTCAGTDTSCGTYPNCVNCNNQDGCSNGMNKDYSCSSGSCVLSSSTCTESCCDTYYGNSNAFCSGNVCNQPPSCSGTDTSCGTYPNCANCNSQDGWICGSTNVKVYRDYYCSGTSCSYSDSQSTDCTAQNGCSGGLSKTYSCSSGSCTQSSSTCTEACCDAYYSNSNAFCSGSTCNPPPQTCGGTDTFCGTYPNCINCDTQDTCVNGIYKNYSCSSGSCVLSSSTCTESCCDTYYSSTNAFCSGGACNAPPSTCAGTDTSCGTYPNCVNCVNQNGCSNGLSKTYGCSSGSCVQTASSCTEACCDAYYGSPDAFCSGGACNPPFVSVPDVSMTIEGNMVIISANNTISGSTRNFTLPITPIFSLAFGVTDTVDNFRMTIEQITEDQISPAPPLDKTVFSYITITKEGIEDANMNNVKIGFEVENSWVQSNGIDPSTIALYRYSGGWDKLPTDQISEDSNYIYFESTSPGLSIFAIAGESISQPVQQCPLCNSPGNWSACTDGKQTRINYVCDETTNFTCASFEQTQVCGEIPKGKGFDFGILLVPILLLVVVVIALIFYFKDKIVKPSTRSLGQELTTLRNKAQQLKSRGYDVSKAEYALALAENALRSDYLALAAVHINKTKELLKI